MPWNRAPTPPARPPRLSPEHQAVLTQIGRTQEDPLPNGALLYETPCAVTTKRGEHIDLAIVVQQQSKPWAAGGTARSASEIAEIRPSPHALPREVRVATTRAFEIRNTFAPTMVTLGDGRNVVLNGPTNFFVEKGYAAGDVRLSDDTVDMDDLPKVYVEPPGVVYFWADEPSPGDTPPAAG